VLALLGAVALVAAPAGAKKHHSHKPAGVKGVVLNSTCTGACPAEPSPEPVYTGAVTITVSRASDGTQVASQAATDGHFRIRVKAGLYDVRSVPPTPPVPPPCEPQPQIACPLTGDGPRSAVIVRPCTTGETKRVRVRRHHFAHLELHVANICIV
jgi:hypothetical protein